MHAYIVRVHKKFHDSWQWFFKLEQGGGVSVIWYIIYDILHVYNCNILCHYETMVWTVTVLVDILINILQSLSECWYLCYKWKFKKLKYEIVKVCITFSPGANYWRRKRGKIGEVRSDRLGQKLIQTIFPKHLVLHDLWGTD